MSSLQKPSSVRASISVGNSNSNALTSPSLSSSSSSSSYSSSMDGVAIIRQYVDKLVHLNNSTGNHSHNNNSHSNTTMKVLLLDANTTQIISSVYTQTEILQQHIYLVTTLEKSVQQKASNSTNVSSGSSGSSSNSSSNSHLTAICFIRPTSTNIDLLCQELQQPPHYAEYHIYFTGTLQQPSQPHSSSTNYLRKIAEYDIYEKVRHIYEYYADFLPCNNDLWTLQCRNTLSMTMSAGTSYAPQHATQYERHITAICHMLLAMKKRPSYIRYASHSPCAEEMARDIYDVIQNDDRYYFRTTTQQPKYGDHHHHHHTNGGLLLFIVDRRDDPVTPLLSQWTYQAMVHELLGLNNQRVILKGTPGITDSTNNNASNKELEEVVLSSTDDEFYNQHKFSNFGVLGEAIQQLLHDYQQQSSMVTNSKENLTTIHDIQQFMEKYPELHTKSHVVSKHVAIMSELARLVSLCSLMDVSQFEQALACHDDHTLHWRELIDKLSSTTIKVPDKLRLSLLYALRYETSANLHMLQQHMSKNGVPMNMISLIPSILRYGGYEQRTPNRLYSNQNIMTRMTKNIVGTIAGVDNVYAQHVPLIIETVQQILRGKLSSKDFPYILLNNSNTTSNNNNNGGNVGASSGGHNRSMSMTSPSSMNNSATNSHGIQINNNNHNNIESIIPDEILIFMVGGVTYEEGMKITELNKELQSRTSNNKSTIRIVLAGSTIHNSTSFLDELRATAM
jgi:vacuolar protein sorting-associated protein 45